MTESETKKCKFYPDLECNPDKVLTHAEEIKLEPEPVEQIAKRTTEVAKCCLGMNIIIKGIE